MKPIIELLRKRDSTIYKSWRKYDTRCAECCEHPLHARFSWLGRRGCPADQCSQSEMLRTLKLLL